MTNPTPIKGKPEFAEHERATLHSLAEMFSEKDDRDLLRQLLHEGVTLKELIMAYKTKRRMVGSLKALGALVVLGGAVVGTLKGFGLWPWK